MIRKLWVGTLVGMLGTMTLVFGDAHAASFPALPFNKPAVIAGAKLFADHCSACHAVSSLRYNRLAIDLGMSKAVIKRQIMLPNGANYLQGMQPTMTQADAKKWFGLPPPNLSHMVRAKGARWIYTYLTSFYWDPKRPSGWNNHVFPNVAMPNILAPWGGIYTKNGKLVKAGRESQAVYHKQVGDLVAFLRYASDPSVFERREIGRYVLGFFILLAVLAYFLKKDYWKDIDHPRDAAEKGSGVKGDRAAEKRSS
jgi:ubiquinol-cytochrome c reductase cytochrome c1 subunit